MKPRVVSVKPYFRKRLVWKAQDLHEDFHEVWRTLSCNNMEKPNSLHNSYVEIAF
jgi:hypothetical protein